MPQPAAPAPDHAHADGHLHGQPHNHAHAHGHDHAHTHTPTPTPTKHRGLPPSLLMAGVGARLLGVLGLLALLWAAVAWALGDPT